MFTAHDIEANVGRFGAFYLSLKDGRILPSWAGYVANGYGSPILLYSYLLPYYLQLPLRLVGLSLVDVTKLYLLISSGLSGVFMWWWLKKHVSNVAAVVGSLLYVWAPYRINDIFARGSISEHTAFMVIPLVGLALLMLATNGAFQKKVLLSLSFIGLLLSHPFFAIIMAPFFVIYSATLFISLPTTKRFGYITSVIQSVILAICISAFFIMPFVFERKYLHYDLNPFSNTWKDQFVSLLKLVKPEWTFIDATGKMEYQTWQIGIPHIMAILGAVVAFYFSKKEMRRLFIAGFLTLVTSLFFMLSISTFLYRLVPIFQQIQFPWRFMGLTVLSTAFLGALASETFITRCKNKQTSLVLLTALGVLILIFYFPHSKGHGYVPKTDTYYLYQLETNTEGVATTPFWAATPENYQRASYLPLVLPTQGADVRYLYRNNTEHVYQVNTLLPSTVIDQTFYFPNWEVWVNGQKQTIEFQNPDYRGLITFPVPAGNNLVEVKFSDTRVRTLGLIISGLTLGFVCIRLVVTKRRLAIHL